MKKLGFLLWPTMLMPYVVLLSLSFIFLNNPVSKFFMEKVFGGFALWLILTVALFAVIAVVCTLIYFFTSVAKNADVVALSKYIMIIKLIQIPAYVLIFVLGLMFLITIFTMPFSIVLFFIDCLVLGLTGLISVGVIILSVRQKYCTWKEVLWIAICQFIFCVDVVASVVLFNKIKRKSL